jgi:hypothetical protein
MFLENKGAYDEIYVTRIGIYITYSDRHPEELYSLN